MAIIDGFIGGSLIKLRAWFHAHILRNPSGQDQISDHLCPHGFQTFFLISIPKVGIYLGLIPVLAAIYKEFVEDKHWRDFLSKSDDGADGRVDLFFRLLGSGLAYLTLIWR